MHFRTSNLCDVLNEGDRVIKRIESYVTRGGIGSSEQHSCDGSKRFNDANNGDNITRRRQTGEGGGCVRLQPKLATVQHLDGGCADSWKITLRRRTRAPLSLSLLNEYENGQVAQNEKR